MNIKDLIGHDDEFGEFEMSEVMSILRAAENVQASDVAHAEKLQHRCIVGTRILLEYESKIIQTVSKLSAKIPAVRAKYALSYKGEEGEKRPTDKTKDYAYKQCPEALELEEKLGLAMAAKNSLQKYQEVLNKFHYYYRDICARQNGSMKNEGSKNNSEFSFESPRRRQPSDIDNAADKQFKDW